MTAIRPTNSTLRDKIDTDGYNSVLNEINAQYTEMDKFISNLNSDISVSYTHLTLPTTPSV